MPTDWVGSRALLSVDGRHHRLEAMTTPTYIHIYKPRTRVKLNQAQPGSRPVYAKYGPRRQAASLRLAAPDAPASALICVVWMGWAWARVRCGVEPCQPSYATAAASHEAWSNAYQIQVHGAIGERAHVSHEHRSKVRA